MRFLKTNNQNWRKLCKGEVQAQQLEINFKECGGMTKEDEGKAIKVISTDIVDECYGIEVGDLGEIESIQSGIIKVLMTTGQGKNHVFPMDESQLEVMKP